MIDAPRRGGDLVLAADSHIGPDDGETPVFEAFLASLAGNAAVVYLLGDVFSLWLGAPKYTAAHHLAVLESCRRLRGAGVRVGFVEGNREFATSRWSGDCFDEVIVNAKTLDWGGGRWRLSHGDLLNRRDVRGRVFRAVMRSPAALALLHALPSRPGLALAARIERSLRRANLRRRTAIPEDLFARHLEWMERRGVDAAVVGHIHVERLVERQGADGRTRRLFVLPDWRSTHRFLRVSADGAARFETWGAAAQPAPAVVAVLGRREDVTLVFERSPGLAVGAALAVAACHGEAVRRGVVLALDAHDSTRVSARLEAGPPILVGDRLIAAPRGAPAAAEEERLP